ncbi:hypothetical protein Pfo_016209 [Paulownia fortunei]|nr:hypothetical protein Pfo_016209 [Paulownia fortunei]
MSFFCLQQSRPAKKTYKPLHTTTVTEKPLRRICRFTDSGDDSVGQNTEPSNKSVQQDINLPFQGDSSGQRELSGLISSQQKPASTACCCCQNKISVDNSNQKTVSKEEFTVRELEATLPRFGPSYGEDTEAFKAAKKEAWLHVLNKTPDEEQSTVSGIYLSAIKRIEKEARDTYAPAIVNRLMRSQFQWMMIIDGCFFLQLALYILGGSEQLGYPEKHVYFGTPNDREISRWIKAMFFVGNQIPCVVIRELMKQSFFQEVIKKGTWNLPSDLPKMVLYLLVVLPELERNGLSSSGLFSNLIGQKRAPYFREPPSDLLHGFHCLVVGPGNDPMDFETEDVPDLEAGPEDLDRNNRFPSATELKQSGITLKRAKRGIREIHFSRRFFLFAYLYVPPFTFDGDTELMLRYLKSYEIEQQLIKSKREVTAYLRFMRDLIQTQKDVNILESKGIIEVKKKDHKDKLPGMLSRLGASGEITFTQNLRLTRLQLIDYSRPPWHLLSLALFLTVVQTVFTILSYFLPRN